MAILEIVTDDHPALKKSCKKVRKITEEIRQLAAGMLDTLDASGNGVGLAANQVARNVRVIAVWDGEEGTDIYINPKIVSRSGQIDYDTEGCLSFPTLFGTVGRDTMIELHAQDLDMKKIKLVVEGFRARIFQHEVDHLNGITFLERVEEGTLKEVIPGEDDDEPEEGEASCAGAETADTVDVERLEEINADEKITGKQPSAGPDGAQC